MGVSFSRSIFACLLAAALCCGLADAARVRRAGQQAQMQMAAGGSYLGLVPADVDAERAASLKLGSRSGVEIRVVEEGGPADRAGIEPGDILLSYNGEHLLGAQQLVRLVQETPAGRKIKVQIWRGGRVRSVLITTGAPRQTPTEPFAGFPYGADAGPLPPSADNVPRAVLVWRNLLVGIEFEELDSQLSDYFGVPAGVLVRWVEKGSPAEKSGLHTGDVIVSVRHKAVSSARDLTCCLRQPGAPVSILLVRNHKKMDVTLTLSGQR